MDAQPLTRGGQVGAVAGEGDAPVAVLDEVLDGEPDPRGVIVVDDVGIVADRLPIHEHDREPGGGDIEIALVGPDRRHDETARSPTQEVAHNILLPVRVVTQARDEGRHVRLARDGVDGAHDHGEERIPDVGDGDAEHRDPPRPEDPGDRIRDVTEIPHHAAHPLAGLGTHVRIVIEDAGDGLLAHSRARGHLAHGDHRASWGSGRGGRGLIEPRSTAGDGARPRAGLQGDGARAGAVRRPRTREGPCGTRP